MSSDRPSYAAALRTALRGTAAAYGYTLSIATTLSVVMGRHGKPAIGELFLFAVGGVCAFALLEALLVVLPGATKPAPDHAFPLAGAFNLLSVSAALGAATGVSELIGGRLVWLLAPLCATAVYMLLVAVQVTAVATWRAR